MAEVPLPVVKKLLFFTALMIIAPLSTFFITDALFDNSIASGGLAALMANVVMMAYVYVAFSEDDTPEKEEKTE